MLQNRVLGPDHRFSREQLVEDTLQLASAIVDWRFTTDDARIKLKRLYLIVKVRESA